MSTWSLLVHCNISMSEYIENFSNNIVKGFINSKSIFFSKSEKANSNYSKKWIQKILKFSFKKAKLTVLIVRGCWAMMDSQHHQSERSWHNTQETRLKEAEGMHSPGLRNSTSRSTPRAEIFKLAWDSSGELVSVPWTGDTDSVGEGGAHDLAALTSSQVTPLPLLVKGPHFELI